MADPPDPATRVLLKVNVSINIQDIYQSKGTTVDHGISIRDTSIFASPGWFENVKRRGQVIEEFGRTRAAGKQETASQESFWQEGHTGSKSNPFSSLTCSVSLTITFTVKGKVISNLAFNVKRELSSRSRNYDGRQ